MKDKTPNIDVLEDSGQLENFRQKVKKTRLLLLAAISAVVLASCATPSSTDSSGSSSTEEVPVENSQVPGAKETVSQANALKAARNYLNLTAFSKKGLIEQLEFDGYEKADCIYASDAIKADWNAQAAKAGKNYLSFTAFSKNSLIEQLEFDGYTKEQARYGAAANGL
jgi:hypothetical protein